MAQHAQRCGRPPRLGSALAVQEGRTEVQQVQPHTSNLCNMNAQCSPPPACTQASHSRTQTQHACLWTRRAGRSLAAACAHRAPRRLRCRCVRGCSTPCYPLTWRGAPALMDTPALRRRLWQAGSRISSQHGKGQQLPGWHAVLDHPTLPHVLAAFPPTHLGVSKL